MGKMKKIGVCMAAVAGAAGIAGLSAKAVAVVGNFESTGFKVVYSIPCFLLLLFVWSFGVLGFLASLAASRFILALSK